MSSAPSSFSRVSIRRSTIAARWLPALDRACMRAREAAVSAVSEPEKKKEKAIRMARPISIAQIMSVMVGSWCHSRRPLSLEECLDLGRRHVTGHEGLADPAREDEG